MLNDLKNNRFSPGPVYYRYNFHEIVNIALVNQYTTTVAVFSMYIGSKILCLCDNTY